jgi:hypothetical protein
MFYVLHFCTWQEVLHLFPPVRSSVLLEPIVTPLFGDDTVPTADTATTPANSSLSRRRSKGQSLSVEFELDQREAKIIDRTKASYIAAVIKQAVYDWKSHIQTHGISRRGSHERGTSFRGSDAGVWWQAPSVEQGIDLTSLSYSKYLEWSSSVTSPLRRPKVIVFSVHEEDLQVRNGLPRLHMS